MSLPLTFPIPIETETLLPSATSFLLTTDTKQFSTSNNDLSVSIVSSERYFDRPDVLEGFRKRLIIQTPSYKEGVPDVGRFRPRGPEDAQVDTSDATYERRHRKYETFEKRQRLREKEKLKHEQYKLKERIEQLRVMDVSAFLALPASDFSPAPGIQEEDADVGIAVLQSAHVNGATAHNEGERRRKEMLDIALALEARFRVLLPPDRIRKSQPRLATREDTTTTPTTSHAVLRRTASDAEASEKEEEVVVPADDYNQRHDKIKIKLKLAGKDSTSGSPAPTSASRASKRSGMTNLPPPQKPRRRQSPIVFSHSPSPVVSRSHTEEPEVPTHLTSERTVSPYIDVEELPEQEEQLGPTSEKEVLSPDHGHPTLEQITDLVGIPQSASPVPPQKRTPLPDLRPVTVPEMDSALVEQGALEGIFESPQSLPPPEDKHEGPPTHAIIESLPEPPPLPHFPSPPPIATLHDVSPSPQPNKSEPAPRRRQGRPPKQSEQKSRLLELAEAVQSISTGPPTKRKKTYHHHLSVKSRAPSHPSLQAVELDQSLMPATSPEPYTRQSRSPPPEPSSEARDPITFLALPDSSISASGSRRNARRGATIAEYQSDTGELRWTTTQLLVAAIRGSQRQAQRHQMAFGVKVPDQVADPYDFWLPDEYLPEEELQKYGL